MDILVSSAYFRGMIARLVTMLALLAITVVTTVTLAHAARMNTYSGMQNATHVGEMMMHGADSAIPGCDRDQPCESTGATLCDFVCHSIPLVFDVPGVAAGSACGPAAFRLPVADIGAGRAPDLNERPPERRLL